MVQAPQQELAERTEAQAGDRREEAALSVDVQAGVACGGTLAYGLVQVV